jgi:DNA repair photolyase
LLRAADARVPRPVAGHRLRDQAVREAGRAEAAARGAREARLRLRPIALGTNTDPYQPIEREWKITRQVLEVLAEHEHPFSIVTKNALVERDLDILAPMAAKRMARAYLSITTLDPDLARKLEPRASAPARRLQAFARSPTRACRPA